MPNTLKALLLIPLALLASCATGPKLTPEMEALRLSLNQRMANTSSIELSASAMEVPNSVIYEDLTKTYKFTTTTIHPNCDLIINLRDVCDYGLNKKSLRYSHTEFATIKLAANRLKSVSASMSDVGKKGRSVSGGELGTDGVGSHLAWTSDTYDCVLIPGDRRSFKIVKDYSEPSHFGKNFEFGPDFKTVATSPDKAFIEGIVRDMNRFIELYKALPK